LKVIEELPDDAGVEDALDRLYLLYKAERGLRQAERGELISQEETRQRTAEYWLALIALVALGLRLFFIPLNLPQPAAVAPQLQIAPTTPSPRESSRTPAVVPSPVPRKTSGVRRSYEYVAVPDFVVSDTLVHTTMPGENVTVIARQYLSHTIYMTTAELESAIRQTHAGKVGAQPSPGDQLVIPGYESVPPREQPVVIPRDSEVRAIYLTGLMAGSTHGLDLIRRWKALGGNAIVFDIKDSDGSVSVPFNHELGPQQRHHHIENLPKFARFLHSLGLHGIARIAVFRDERLVQHHPEFAVQSRQSDRPWREHGKLVWTDPSRREVQDYNIALAKLAATSGIDEVQFDYIRFPTEDDQKDAHFFFQEAHPEWRRSQVICDFLSRAYSELHPLGVLFSLDVFGVMAWQTSVDVAHTGQDIVAMARFCDILSPMIYPSHFFGMEGYDRPGDQPEHFIGESMERFHALTKDTGTKLRPWLQAFAWRTKSYSAGYILTQIRVAKENGGIGYLFWNAGNDYSKPFVAMTELRGSLGRPGPGGQPQTSEAIRPPSSDHATNPPPLP
jgi:hypothetical protein